MHNICLSFNISKSSNDFGQHNDDNLFLDLYRSAMGNWHDPKKEPKSLITAPVSIHGGLN